MTDPGGIEREPRTVKAVETALDVVEALEELRGGTVTELAEHLDLSKGAVHNHLVTLETRGYLIRDGYTYRPGLRFLEVGEMMKRHHLDVYNVGRVATDELAEATGEYAWLQVEERGLGKYIYKARGADAVETGNFPLGRPIPLHATAGGKAILACLSRDRVEEILDEHGQELLTDDTVTDREELFDQLERIEDRGFARSSEESVAGIRAVAAPIHAADGSVLGAISVSGPVSRLKSDTFETALPEKLVEYANIVEINVLSETQLDW